MLKKYFLSAALCGLFAVATPAFANASFQTEEVPAQEQVVAISETAEMTPVEVADHAVATAEKSTRERQLEKARNAEENDSWGGVITIVAMSIVLMALIVLSILFLCFGKISAALLTKKKREAHGMEASFSTSNDDELDSGEVMAAIGMALAEHFGQAHDTEDTILTIKRMQKSYSPWNSKIYNLRQNPEVMSAPRRPLK